MLTETIHFAVPTAFLEDESLNIQGTISHIKNLYEQGIKSVLVSGSTGEQHSLNLQEKIELINALEIEEGLITNMEIIFGVSSIRQKEAERLAEHIRHTRLSGILIGYPPYIIPSQEEAVIYTKKIIQLANKPAILYNNPRRTGFDLSVTSIIELSKEELMVGIKDAGNKEKIERIKNGMHRKDIHFYMGGEKDAEEKVSYGYDRLSSIAGNVYPMEISHWFQQLMKNQSLSEQETKTVDSILEEVYAGNAIVNLKKKISQNGTSMGICRSPIGNI